LKYWYSKGPDNLDILLFGFDCPTGL